MIHNETGEAVLALDEDVIETIRTRRSAGESLPKLPAEVGAYSSSLLAVSRARSILAMVAVSGVVLPFSIRFRVSARMAARRARSAWVSPACRRALMIFRASETRAYATAG